MYMIDFTLVLEVGMGNALTFAQVSLLTKIVGVPDEQIESFNSECGSYWRIE